MTDIIFADNTSQEMREEVLNLSTRWKPHKRNKLVQGVGINDADYMIVAMTSAGRWTFPLYRKWHSMMTRAYSHKMHDKCPTYDHCIVDVQWHSFMTFRKWAIENGWRYDLELDKDLICNEKIYSADTCVFLPQSINKFMTDCRSARGQYPLGVNEYQGKYSSNCRDPMNDKQEYLGRFNTPDEAHNAWRQRKHQHALALAAMYPDLDPRVLNALRTRYKD
ncbi:hypothetical protein G8O18_14105 [Enterobacter kobei]|uniref:hypothetical protein n=1 Tax=Enterobacter kobei TaxID=208224 RepID=UPI002F2E764F